MVMRARAVRSFPMFAVFTVVAFIVTRPSRERFSGAYDKRASHFSRSRGALVFHDGHVLHVPHKALVRRSCSLTSNANWAIGIGPAKSGSTSLPGYVLYVMFCVCAEKFRGE